MRSDSSSRRWAGSPLLVLFLFRFPVGLFPCAFRVFLGVGDDASVLRDLGGVVCNADFVVKQLAADVARKLHQFTGLLEQATLPVELLNALGKRSQQCFEVASATFVVRLFRLRHGGEAASLKDRCAVEKT